MNFDFQTGEQNPTPPELAVVIPVFNEQDSIQKVIGEWIPELEKWCSNFVVLAIDDGSRDHSLAILYQLQEQFGKRLVIITRPNRGHGQTCLEGYHYAGKLGARFVFQIDSDWQCDPRYFPAFWQIRNRAFVISGVRTSRDDGWKRIIVTKTLRLMLLLAFRVDCPDANVPYRLMQTEAIQSAILRIPEDFHLANVALAVLLRRDKSVTHSYVPIGFRERYGGEPSVKLPLFGRKAIELYRNIQTMLTNQAKSIQ
ncbi:Undecaprenyl-phosphate 4-deoxy-4-formamido-L-arabinose transferase [Dyadobacter sp. CECT 9275]|uniref:Undecaprenyl-phosphate 4-deoxy-4-formamido-L-arabinose transferase n=1 Tax=Dyadobacter helix TaxID=2822344 RepID=A0A916JHN2_9BACT|nr:glycosyltransferase family 2 protein [Dyadobacter sp. CECT 9275]CAG5018005.1 Undecaprenyl-phosphate 4-deoxy-4-formamido-L-arabinose transferase [Dyadobacter sp. CECT 9275]